MIYETEEDGDEITQDLWQEACWIVISSYFDEKKASYDNSSTRLTSLFRRAYKE